MHTRTQAEEEARKQRHPRSPPHPRRKNESTHSQQAQCPHPQQNSPTECVFPAKGPYSVHTLKRALDTLCKSTIYIHSREPDAPVTQESPMHLLHKSSVGYKGKE